MVAAIVILFFPDRELLVRLLASLEGQVSHIYLVDNTPEGKACFDVQTLYTTGDLTYLPLGENIGIASAQNRGMEVAGSAGYDWFLLMDQDSAIAPGMVAGLKQATLTLEGAGKKVAVVGPRFCDAKTGEYSTAIRHSGVRIKKISLAHTNMGPVAADYIIASGSLLRGGRIQELGGMLDELFIDWVDIEWGLRAKAAGYTSYIVPAVTMMHSIGDESVQVGQRNINLHSHFRNYHIVRNATWLLRKSYMGWSWRFITFVKIPQYIVFYAWHSTPKAKNFFSLCRAFLDGLAGRVGPVNF